MRSKKAFLNAISGIFFLVILTIFGFFASHFFVQKLGIEYNGLNGLFSSVLAVLAITELGIGGAITFSLYKPIYENDTKKIAAIMKLFRNCYRIIGTAIFCLALVFSFFIHYFIHDNSFSVFYVRIVFLLYALGTSISYFFSYNRNLFYAYQKNYIVAFSDFIVKTIKITLQTLSLFVWRNYVLYLLLNVIFTFVSNLVVHILARKVMPEVDMKNTEIDKELRKSVLSSVKNLAILQLAAVGINSTGSIIISSFIGIKAVGIYTNYNLIITQLFQVLTMFFSGIGASIGNLIAENNKERIKEIFINLDYFSFFIASYAIGSLFFIVQPFITMLYGGEYLLEVSIVAVLCINFYILIKRQPINYYYYASGYFKKFIFPSFLELILNIVLSIILVKYYGLIGVFIGTTIASTISWFIGANIFHKLYEISFGKYLLRQLLFIILILLEVLIFKGITLIFLPSNLIFQIVYLMLVGVVVPNVFSLIIIFKSSKTEYLRMLISKISKRIFKK